MVVLDAANGAVASFNREAQRIVAGLGVARASPVERLAAATTCRRGDGRTATLDDLGRAERVRAEEVELSVPGGAGVHTLLDTTPTIAPFEALARSRAEFLSTVSPELRAPLAAIKGSATTALEGARDPDRSELRQFLRIVGEADRVDGLIGDPLDAGRIGAGMMPVDPEARELAGLLDRARTAFAGAGPHAVVVDLPPGLPGVMADARRIVQVLYNLLGNAVRHSPEASPIRVAAEPDGGARGGLGRRRRRGDRAGAAAAPVPPPRRHRPGRRLRPPAGQLPGLGGGAPPAHPRRQRRAGPRHDDHLHPAGGGGRVLSAAAVDGNGWTDLHYAAALGWAALARPLLAAGSPVNAPLRTDAGPLGLRLLSTLSSCGQDRLRRFRGATATPLHVAAADAREVVAIMLEGGANPDVAEATTATPLDYATAGPPEWVIDFTGMRSLADNVAGTSHHPGPSSITASSVSPVSSAPISAAPAPRILAATAGPRTPRPQLPFPRTGGFPLRSADHPIVGSTTASTRRHFPPDGADPENRKAPGSPPARGVRRQRSAPPGRRHRLNRCPGLSRKRPSGNIVTPDVLQIVQPPLRVRAIAQTLEVAPTPPGPDPSAHGHPSIPRSLATDRPTDGSARPPGPRRATSSPPWKTPPAGWPPSSAKKT